MIVNVPMIVSPENLKISGILILCISSIPNIPVLPVRVVIILSFISET